MIDDKDVRLVYDGDCPICDYYSRRIDIADGELVRINARKQCELVDELTTAGYDLDEGMILKDGGNLYYGDDALRELARRSSGKGLFNRFASSVFRHPRIASIVYPLLTACRKLLLRVLGRSRIKSRR